MYFRKLIKVVQYTFVIISEFNLMRYFLRVIRGGKAPGVKEVEDWFFRTKKMGSALSTTRMSLRFLGWITSVKWVAEQIKNYLNNSK